MRFAVCPKCKVSIALPEEYLNYGAWLSAHMKSCPGGGEPRIVARVRRSRRRKKLGEQVESDPEVRATADAVKAGIGQFGRKVVEGAISDLASAAAQAVINAVFKK
jgi:hypothetical protein